MPVEKQDIIKCIEQEKRQISVADKELVASFLVSYFSYSLPIGHSGYGLDYSDLDYIALALALRKTIFLETFLPNETT